MSDELPVGKAENRGDSARTPAIRRRGLSEEDIVVEAFFRVKSKMIVCIVVSKIVVFIMQCK